MELPSEKILAVINVLVPGFLAAWVFYGLTAHRKTTPFERTIQALIFTLFVQGMTLLMRLGMEHLVVAGWFQSFGPWDENSTTAWSAVNAVTIGILFALFANRGWAHRFLQLIGLTTRTSFPSEWFSAFNRYKSYVVLHLKGERRLHGFPEEWPDHPDAGHFLICNPKWILPDNECAPLYQVKCLLIPASEVEMVEILKDASEVTATDEQLLTVEKLLVKLQKEDSNDGKQSAPATTEVRDAADVRTQANDGRTIRVEAIHAAPAPTQKVVNQDKHKHKGQR